MAVAALALPSNAMHAAPQADKSPAPNAAASASPPMVEALEANDVPLDQGGEVELRWKVPAGAAGDAIDRFVVQRTLGREEFDALLTERRKAAFQTHLKALLAQGVAPEQARTQAGIKAREQFPKLAPGAALPIEWLPQTTEVPRPKELPQDRVVTTTIAELDPGSKYHFQVFAVDRGGAKSSAAAIGPVGATPGGFLLKRAALLGWIVVISGAVMFFILLARTGRVMRIRRIAALEAVDEAVGRATEMGRPVLFIPGIQDMDNVQTIAGITILSRVAKTVAEYDATIEVPTSRSLAMQAAKEAVQASYMQAGRSDSFNPDAISYITDEQFGFVAYTAGRMVREKPAACFYLGCFYAESLILAETGNSIGAIQIAGTAESSQLPFFVAACDYTLIGEEFFAASAYLSGEPDQLGSIKGQDVGKVISILVIVVVALALSIQVAAMKMAPATGPSVMSKVADASGFVAGKIKWILKT